MITTQYRMGSLALSLVLALAACASESPAVTTQPAFTSTQVPTTTTTLPPASTTTTIATTTTLPWFEASIETVDEDRLGHSWHKGCPVGPEDLNLVVVTYWDFDGEADRGEIIIDSAEARSVIAVFETLFDSEYPIQSMIPIGDLPEDAEDDPAYSNTSGFHCRVVDGTNRWSEHAFGRAIDMNPHLNPLVSSEGIWPADAIRYVDRSLDEPGMIANADATVEAFASIGWSWGGDWSSLKDYHHFSASGR